MQLPPRCSYPYLLRRIPLKTVLLAAIAFLGMAISDRIAGSQTPPRNSGPPQRATSSDSREGEADSPMLREHSLGINLNAFNQERRKEIAKDSEKLLALTTALKSELDMDPNRARSDDVVRKVKEIEKLAHQVKTKMLADPTPSPLLH